MCVECEKAARALTGKGWLTSAAKHYGIEVMVATLDEDTRQSLLGAQKQQNMINR